MVHILFRRAGVHNSTDQGVKIAREGRGGIDGYNNEAVKGAGAFAFYYIFFCGARSVLCAMVFFS